MIRAIDSDTKIILKEGTYNLSKVINQENPHIKWVDEFDGAAPEISGISNLTMIGKGRVEIIIESQYSWVLSFKNCNNLSFTNLIVGHTEKGYCLGGCFSFDGGQNIYMKKCDLYGSGTEGVRVENIRDFTFFKSRIRECSYYLTQIFDSNDVTFKKSILETTEEFNLIAIHSSSNVLFNKCTLQNNKTSQDFMPYLFDIENDTFKVNLEKCKILNNNVGKFSNNLEKMTLKKNTFSGNSFQDYSDEELNRKNQ